MNRLRQVLSIFLSCWIALATCPGGLAYAADDTTSPTPVVSAPPTVQELQQLVAPIALYPDSLVAQILAASAYPDQVVEQIAGCRHIPNSKEINWPRQWISNRGIRVSKLRHQRSCRSNT